MHVPFFSASVVCALMGRRIKCTRQQNEDFQSQAVLEEAAWEESVVVSLACWFERRAETGPAAFSYSGVLRKNTACRVFHVEVVYTFLRLASM